MHPKIPARMETVSRRLRYFVTLLLIGSPLAYLAQVLLTEPGQWLALPPGTILNSESISGWEYALLALIPALTPALFWWILLELRSLSGNYAQGEVFEPVSVDRLRRIGYLLMAVDPVRALQGAVTGPLVGGLGLTQPFMVVELQVSTLVIGLFIVLVSRIMRIACDHYELNQLTV